METGTDEDDRTTEPVSVDTSETETVSLEGDGVSVKSQESSAVPKRSSSGGSTPCDKRSLSPALGASKHAPHSGASRSRRGSQDGMQSPEMHPNRPNRPGIVWTINGKLEAMDFQTKWYPARIVDMDDTDNTVLIHFDGWNQRYDEWVAMDSERLRPLTRTSGRKDKKTTKKSSAKLEHKVGDNVFAKWTDCRMYAGTVVGITPNESYEVLFYDGFKKTVQPINVKSMPLHVQKEYAVAGILPHPSSRPHQKLQMLEKKTMSDEYKRAFKQTKFAKKAPRAGGQSADESTSRTHRGTSSISSPETPQVIKSTKMRLDKLKRRHKQKVLEDSPPLKKAKLVVGGKFQVKKLKSHVGRFDVKERRIRIRSSEVREKKKANRKQCILNLKSRKGFKSAAGGCRTRKRGYNLSKTLFPKSDSVPVEESKVTTDKTDQVEQGTTGRSSQVDTPAPCTGTSTSHDIKKEDALSDDDITLAELIKSPAPASANSQETTATTSPDAKPTVMEAAKHVKQTVQVSSQDPEPAVVVQPKKAFLATPEEKFTCPFENCNKSFRKTKFVECHIKYYHTTDGSMVQTQPPRKRRKTSSICSSDSEVSLPIKQTKKRKENSLPVIQSTETTVNTADTSTMEEAVKQEVTQDTSAEHNHKDMAAAENSDVTADVSADCLSKDEVVNCICQLNEENGLMIQCETCLCWQHAVCMELTEETLPAKYICYVCSNPPGIRESARYSYDQDWLKQGTMARFKFLPEDPHLKQKAQIMLATHNLVSDLHGVNRVLSSLKCQLHADKDKNHPEVKFWVKNWDKVMEEEELSRQLARANSQAGVSSHKTGENTSKSEVAEVKIRVDQDTNERFADVKHKLDFSNLDLCPESIKEEGSTQDVIKGNKEQNVIDEKPPMKEEISKEQGVSDGKPLVKDDMQEEGPPGKFEIKQEKVKGQKDEENLEVKQEKAAYTCSRSASEGLFSSTTLSEKQTSSHEQSSDKPDIPNQHGSRLNESDTTGGIAASSSVGSEKQTTLSENLSSSSLSSLNEDIASKTNTQNLSSQDPNPPRPVVTVQEQPFISCEHNLLEHICFMQDNVESRLDLIEEQISVLEKADDNSNGSGAHDGDVLRDVPRVKKAIHHILNDLFKVKRMALYR